jgi:hypothetical protein
LEINLLDLTVRPKDPSLNKDYDFKIKATATGDDSVVTEKKSLQVGCTSSMIITFPDNYSSTLVSIGSNPDKVFRIQPLTISRPYCELIENIVIEDSIKVNGVEGKAKDIKLNDPSDPLSSFIDISDANNLSSYTFSLTQKFKGGYNITT